MAAFYATNAYATTTANNTTAWIRVEYISSSCTASDCTTTEGYGWGSRGRQYSLSEHHAARAAETEAERAEKSARALDLLLAILPAAERDRWSRDGVIEVRSSAGRRFAIVRGRMHNVFRLTDAGRVDQELCALPSDPSLPVEDVVIAQKLALESDEESFCSIANRWVRDEALSDARKRAAA